MHRDKAARETPIGSAWPVGVVAVPCPAPRHHACGSALAALAYFVSRCLRAERTRGDVSSTKEQHWEGLAKPGMNYFQQRVLVCHTGREVMDMRRRTWLLSVMAFLTLVFSLMCMGCAPARPTSVSAASEAHMSDTQDVRQGQGSQAVDVAKRAGNSKSTRTKNTKGTNTNSTSTKDNDTKGTGSKNTNTKDTKRTTSTAAIDENGTYTSKDDVALYLHTYGHLPSNFIKKEDAEDAGWKTEGLDLDEACPGKSIGGDRFSNREKRLPTARGRTWYECDIDYRGGRSRGAKRIVYSNDGLIYYTGDHYRTFERLY